MRVWRGSFGFEAEPFDPPSQKERLWAVSRKVVGMEDHKFVMPESSSVEVKVNHPPKDGPIVCCSYEGLPKPLHFRLSDKTLECCFTTDAVDFTSNPKRLL
ncbi:hypothetical protein BV898_14328 [Hypsibius exemplaris]|uniref:Uncharacterized protein n=1 Tax=Hypsibius exemplaris TaxID=2072580 RepID=A0A9X6NBX4_HYPEX|nr:hypothetical protein BV898_14328 [Hypsibius exemplaris]